jgi:cobalt-zinc-cadmium efflux system outer membrane protein
MKTLRYHFPSNVLAAHVAVAAVVLALFSPLRAEEETLPTPPADLTEVVIPLPALELTTPVAVGLSLSDLESMALACNPTLVRAQALVAAARGTCVQVGLKPNPNVGYEGQQLGSGGLAEQHGILLEQEIVTGGKLRLNRAVASQQVAIAEQEFVAVRQRILTDIRITFFQVLVAQRQIEVATELARLSEEVSKSVDALHRAQEVGRVDVLQADLERQQADILAQSAQQRLAGAWRELAAVIGEPTLVIQTLIGDPAAPSSDITFDEALARLLSQSPEVASAAAEIQRARLALERERVQTIPNVTVQGLVNWQDNGIGGQADGGVMLSVPVPVFDRNQGAIMRAGRELVAARQAMAQLELDLQQRLAPVYENYANARQQAMQYRNSILPKAEESLKLTRVMYQAGEINYTGLLTAQRTFAFANREFLDAVLRLRTAEAKIEGLLLSGSLANDLNNSRGP